MIKYHIINTVKIKREINRQDLKIVDLHFVKSVRNNFHSFDVVDRVSDTQLQSHNLTVNLLTTGAAYIRVFIFY